MLHIFKKIKFPKNAGMTAIELVVVMGIFAAISSTVLFNYRNFSNNVALQNLAQDVALQIKRAQTESVSGRLPILSGNQLLESGNLLPTDWKPSYGVAFQTDVANNWDLGGGGFAYYFNKGLPPPPPDFVEVNRDLYDFTETTYEGCGALAPGDSECLEEIKISSGDYIDMLCFNFTTINESCTAGGGIESVNNQAFISFTRPRGNAIIMDGSVDDGGASPYDNVFIRITSPSGKHKYISVWASGYISIR